MLLISHRGNLNGKLIERENTELYIEEALHSGYDVEIDVWNIDGSWFLGHDGPFNKTNVDFICRPNIWIHCKNIEALSILANNYKNGLADFFTHDKDDYTITSRGYIWTYPDKKVTNKCICVLPEISKYTIEEIKSCAGICSDFIERYK